MRAVSDTRMIIGSLIASNMVLMALHVAPSMQRFLRQCAMRLWPKAPASLQPSPLGGLLGKDYIPPLPEPVINVSSRPAVCIHAPATRSPRRSSLHVDPRLPPQVLNRACLCFLATASVELLPHLSLMRFSYCKSLSAADDEAIRTSPVPCLPRSSPTPYRTSGWHPLCPDRLSPTPPAPPFAAPLQCQVLVLSTRRETLKYKMLTQVGLCVDCMVVGSGEWVVEGSREWGRWRWW